MNSQAQLREEIVNRVLDEMAGKYDNPREYMNAIMAKVQEYEAGVIGEFQFILDNELEGVKLDKIQGLIYHLAEQRKRAGL